jgi:RimJ/RimL family protein N-acetyltransferase
MLPEIPIRFETKRLILRRYHTGDGAWYYEGGQKNHQHLQRFESGNVILSLEDEEDGEKVIGELAAEWNAHKSFFLGAFEKSTGQFAAQIYIGVVNWQLPEFEIGYFADKDHEGRGYVTEAVRGTLVFIFQHLKAHRVSLHCSDKNERSRRVAEHCGFIREGHLRETHLQPDGTFSGDFSYGLLRSEFEDQQSATGSGG